MPLVRRHSKRCKFYGSDASSKTRCTCPIQYDTGKRGAGSRVSMGTRDWARAEMRLRKMLDAQEQNRPVATVADACKVYLDDCTRRNLDEDTIDSYGKTLDHLQKFCDDQGHRLITEV